MSHSKTNSSSPAFSVIIPTYSGVETIGYTLTGIATQEATINYELIIVIDGPNKEISRIAQEAKKEFARKGVETVIKQFKENRGRFEARLAGAQAASADRLLFIDDRVRLDNSFFDYIKQSNEKAIMPNVIELGTTNIISLTLGMLRKRIYGKKLGAKFADYYIDTQNFESSPKGTAGLYVKKDVFLIACQKVKASNKKSTKHVNDDTKILRTIVDDNNKIMRAAKLNIYYLPRESFREALRHLYNRGPLFVDYYIKPNTRFFPLLVVIYLVIVLLAATLVLNPLWLIYYFAVSAGLVVIGALTIAKSPKEYVTVLIGLPIVGLTFLTGVLKGTLLKIFRNSR